MKFKIHAISISALFLLSSVTISANECLVSKNLRHMPVNNIFEYCFKSEVKDVKSANLYNFIIKIESGDQIPQEYRKLGIKGVVNVSPVVPGVFSNIFIDLKNGSRKEYTIISTDNKVKTKKHTK